MGFPTPRSFPTLACSGEDFIGLPDKPLHLALQEKMPDADLLLVLNTGPAPLAELVAISLLRSYEALRKTRVWSPRKYTEGPRSTPGDILKMFQNTPFSLEEFNTCALTGQLVEATDEFLLGLAIQGTAADIQRLI